MSDPRLILIPGLGADRRLFGGVERGVGPVEVPARLDPLPRETLAQYGRRMAERIDARPPFFLGGASLGGMVALEMARHLEPEAVFLIGSCRSGAGVTSILRVMEKLNAVVPTAAFEWFKPLRSGLVPGLKPESRRLFAEMYRDTPGSFTKWACSAIVRWPGPPPLTMPVYHIHGRRDRLLPLHKGKPDYVIESGGHLLNLTHEAEVNAFLIAHLGRK